MIRRELDGIGIDIIILAKKPLRDIANSSWQKEKYAWKKFFDDIKAK